MFADILKKSILQAAIQGKLTKQLESDGDATKLLNKIQVEKNKLIADGKLKPEKPLPPIQLDELPFDIPKNWTWCRLGDVAVTNIGLTYSPANISSDGVIVLRSGNIQDGKIIFKDLIKVDMSIPKDKIANAGDILICARNGSKKLVGKAAIIPEDGFSFGAFMAIVRSKFNPYILMVINSPYFRKTFIDEVGTTTINQITQSMLKNFPIPLPPLAEQERIVARLEQILPEVELLANAESELDDLQNKFPRQFKNSILQDAIQGKLTKQLESDGDATDLLKQIKAEKNKLIADGKLKPEKPLPPISADELPFAIPKNWAWVRLPEIIYTVGGKHNQILAKEIKKSGKYPVISQGQNFIDGFTDEENKLVYDLPLIMFGDHTRNVKFIDFPFVIGADGTKLFKTIKICPKYFFYWMLLTAELLHNRGYNRHYKLLKSELVPLPPLAEQKRIVARLDAILPEVALLDNLQ